VAAAPLGGVFQGQGVMQRGRGGVAIVTTKMMAVLVFVELALAGSELSHVGDSHTTGRMQAATACG